VTAFLPVACSRLRAAANGSAPILFFVATRMGLAGFHCEMIALVTMRAGKMRVVRRVMMMARSRMCTGHDPPEIFQRQFSTTG
jgi:hypothetical protein